MAVMAILMVAINSLTGNDKADPQDADQLTACAVCCGFCHSFKPHFLAVSGECVGSRQGCQRRPTKPARSRVLNPTAWV